MPPDVIGRIARRMGTESKILRRRWSPCHRNCMGRARRRGRSGHGRPNCPHSEHRSMAGSTKSLIPRILSNGYTARLQTRTDPLPWFFRLFRASSDEFLFRIFDDRIPLQPGRAGAVRCPEPRARNTNTGKYRRKKCEYLWKL